PRGGSREFLCGKSGGTARGEFPASSDCVTSRLRRWWWKRNPRKLSSETGTAEKTTAEAFPPSRRPRPSARPRQRCAVPSNAPAPTGAVGPDGRSRDSAARVRSRRRGFVGSSTVEALERQAPVVDATEKSAEEPNRDHAHHNPPHPRLRPAFPDLGRCGAAAGGRTGRPVRASALRPRRRPRPASGDPCLLLGAGRPVRLADTAATAGAGPRGAAAGDLPQTGPAGVDPRGGR